MISPLGDSGLVITWPPEISPKTLSHISQVTDTLMASKVPGLQTCVPGYHTLTVYFDPLTCDITHLKATIKAIMAMPLKEKNQGNHHVIPTLYDGQDLAEVCSHTGLTQDQVIARHSQATYLVYMLGFTPGFAYLGGMDASLATPRRTSPRAKIKAGSVGIAGHQTGIYPIDSPGGWQVIGRTPLALFDLTKASPILFKAGDTLSFKAITQEDYLALGGRL